MLGVPPWKHLSHAAVLPAHGCRRSRIGVIDILLVLQVLCQCEGVEQTGGYSPTGPDRSRSTSTCWPVLRPSENEAATSGNVALLIYKTTASRTMLPCATEAKMSVPQLVRWPIRWHVDTGTACGTALNSL
jgi:hypothetical protein